MKAWLIALVALPVMLAADFGALRNGVYHHNRTGIEFTLPAGWSIVRQVRSSESGAQIVYLKDPATDTLAIAWFKTQKADPANIPLLLDRRLDSKAAQRNNFEGYRYRPDSVRRTTIGGYPALSAVADYLSVGQRMVEYITWIDAPASRILFSVRLPESQLPAFQPRFDEVIQSVVFPAN